MKNEVKKLFIVVLMCAFIFTLTGCGNNNENDPIPNNSKTGDNQEKNDDLELYSDDTKIVYNFSDTYYIIYYHNGSKITGLEYIYDYKDVSIAKSLAAAIKANYDDNDDVEKVEVKGSRIRVVFKNSAYKNETLESIKETYKYLEEVTKK